MNKHWLLWAFLLAQPTFAQMSLSPQSYGQLGEMEPLYLLNRSTYFQLFNNDFIGSTDKHLTNSTGVSYTYNSKWQFGFYRRLITPALSYEYGSPKLSQPYGVLSDDSTFNVATYIPLSSNWVLYPEIGVNFIGNQNARQVYTYIHKTIGSSLNYDLYGREQKTIAVSPGIKLIYEDKYLYGGGGIYSSPYMNEAYLLAGVRYTHNHWAITGQYKFVDQISSKFYNDNEIKDYRLEWQVGLRIDWYLCYFKYTSPFLQNDPVRQYHIAPLNFQWNW